MGFGGLGVGQAGQAGQENPGGYHDGRRAHPPPRQSHPHQKQLDVTILHHSNRSILRTFVGRNHVLV